MTLALAMVLDALMGEPQWLWSRLPHPIVLIGRVIGWADTRFNRARARRAKGAAVVATLVLGGWLIGWVIALIPGASVLAAAILLAQRSLADHVGDVAAALARGLPEGRTAVARIVGRDTSAMDTPAISRAAIESAAENLSDGVIAPAFWFAVAGLPGMLAYKAINTADSMIGYRTPRHEAFGWAAARLDDLVNLIPARLTALLLWLPTRRGDWHGIAADARRHRSPNAGWPEAAMARALGVSLAGPRSYDGRMQDFPLVNDGGRVPGPSDIHAAVRALWMAWGLALALGLLIWVI